MLDRRALRVIAGFCGMILIGLLSLAYIDSLNTNEQSAKNEKATTTTLPPVNTVSSSSDKTTPKATVKTQVKTTHQ